MVRFKNRYLLFELVWADGRAAEEAAAGGEQVLLGVVRDSLAACFGDAGCGSALASLQVKYCNPVTGLVVLRCGREEHRAVWGAVTLLGSVRGRLVLPRLLHVGGTLRSCVRAALRHDLAALQGLRGRLGARLPGLAAAAEARLLAVEP